MTAPLVSIGTVRTGRRHALDHHASSADVAPAGRQLDHDQIVVSAQPHQAAAFQAVEVVIEFGCAGDQAQAFQNVGEQTVVAE